MRRWGSRAAAACLAFGCSGLDTPPFAGLGCTGPFCNQDLVTGQNSTAGATGASGGAGGTGTGGAGGVGLICPVDPASGIALCRTIPSCPTFVIDDTSFPACGLTVVAQGIELDCVCNGSQICTVGFAATCSNLPRLTAAGSITDLCNQAISTTTTCRDIPNLGTAGTCDRNCAVSCVNAPACLRACGC